AVCPGHRGGFGAVFSEMTGERAGRLLEKLESPGANHDLEKVFVSNRNRNEPTNGTTMSGFVASGMTSARAARARAGATAGEPPGARHLFFRAPLLVRTRPCGSNRQAPAGRLVASRERGPARYGPTDIVTPLCVCCPPNVTTIVAAPAGRPSGI